jgi:single-stranded DNA-binding protein
VNNVIISGVLVEEEPYYDVVGDNRTPFFRFHVAVPGGGKGGPKEYRVRCVTYGELATKFYGDWAPQKPVFIDGHLQTRLISPNQKPRWVMEVVAHRIVPLSHPQVLNQVHLSGSVVNDPPYFDFVGPDKEEFLRFHISVPNTSESGPKVSYIRCVAYGATAKALYEKLPKATVFVISGKLQIRALPQSQKPRWIMEVVVENWEALL